MNSEQLLLFCQDTPALPSSNGAVTVPVHTTPSPLQVQVRPLFARIEACLKSYHASFLFSAERVLNSLTVQPELQLKGRSIFTTAARATIDTTRVALTRQIESLVVAATDVADTLVARHEHEFGETVRHMEITFFEPLTLAERYDSADILAICCGMTSQQFELRAAAVARTMLLLPLTTAATATTTTTTPSYSEAGGDWMPLFAELVAMHLRVQLVGWAHLVVTSLLDDGGAVFSCCSTPTSSQSCEESDEEPLET